MSKTQRDVKLFSQSNAFCALHTRSVHLRVRRITEIRVIPFLKVGYQLPATWPNKNVDFEQVYILYSIFSTHLHFS